MKKAKTQNQKLLNALASGKKLTVAQASARFNISNVRARINELRNEGHDIFSDVKTNREGRKVAVYSL